MMPLILANSGEEHIILRIGGAPEEKRHMEDLGFVPGSTVTIISQLGGNIIVNVKNSRVAISREMAQKMFI